MDDIVPGWRQALEALMSWEEPSVNAVPGESKKESDILDEGAAGDKVSLRRRYYITSSAASSLPTSVSALNVVC